MAADYSKCWANALGDCAGGMTLEHLISRNQFGNTTVSVQGYPWCKDEPRTVGIGGVAARILCARHNNTTSPLDDAAGATLGALRLMMERADSMKAGGPRPPRRTIRISGDHLERWLLKTTINLALQARPAPTGGIFDDTGKPARRFIDIVYGRTLFAPEEGLTWVVQVGEQIAHNQQGTIAFQTWLQKDDNALVAAFLGFHGYRLWLATVDAPKIEHGMHPVRRFHAQDVDVVIEFEWSKRRNRQLLALAAKDGPGG